MESSPEIHSEDHWFIDGVYNSTASLAAFSLRTRSRLLWSWRLLLRLPLLLLLRLLWGLGALAQVTAATSPLTLLYLSAV